MLLKILWYQKIVLYLIKITDMQTQFKNIGYFVEYMVDNQFIGSINITEPDRDNVGYYGRIDSVAEQDIVFANKRRIKKGTHYYTRLYPLCGQKK